MERDLIINGFRIYEYDCDPDKFVEEVEAKYADGMNYVHIATNQCKLPDGVPQHYYLEWAKYLTERKMYFCITAGGLNPAGYTEETAKKMKEIAGEYFLSYSLGEFGSSYSCKASGYREAPTRPWRDLQDAKNTFVNHVKNGMEQNKMGCGIPISITESTAMVTYECEAGIDFPTMEIFPGDVEIAVAFTRGAAKSYNCKMWSAYMAHEWYGGLRWDELKQKRFKLGYDYCYMAGGNAFVTESGDENICTHGANYGPDHRICQNYRKVMADFAQFVIKDARPKGGPKVKVAFVRGNLDGYSYRHSGGSLWRGHMQPEYGYGAPEFAWRILETLQCKRRWSDVHNYGDADYSNGPAYGTYDVIPATVGSDIFAKYDYLIFVGWNSMTEEIYSNLKVYVEQGGCLFMTAAHLNTSIKRDGSISLFNGGDVSDLFGCKLDSKHPVYKDEGSKFYKSIVPGLYYPATTIKTSDPYFADGYIHYAVPELTTGVAGARMSNRFLDLEPEKLPISLVENKCGKGYTILMTNLDYPYGAAVPMYQNIVREIFNLSHRQASVKVYGGDALRFTVYEGDKVYLLNTDFDNKIFATVDYVTHKVEVMLEPCELKAIEK